jgi:S-formylglutathione hydrolase FrmB
VHAASGLSLVDGWLPVALQVLVLAVLLVAVGRRPRRFWARRAPVCVAVGVAVAVGSLLVFDDSGLASEPAPPLLWAWVGSTAAAVALAVVGWGGARRWRRALSVATVPLCLLCVGLVVNQWVGYLPSVDEAVAQATAAPVPHQVAAGALPTLRNGVAPTDDGRVVAVTIPDTASGFRHRTEYVYLPPAWFVGAHPPALPALMMIGGEFNTPVDWLRIGGAQAVVDSYAHTHGGTAPILVLVDAGGSFATDTECVDGPRGRAAAHLVDDVRPYVVDRFGASADPRQWGVVGFSMGGTCALDLAVMHPELFDTFEDIAGDAGPEVGSKAETIARLYGGDAAAWARFDPATVLAGHPRYPDTAAWFENVSAADADAPARPGPVLRGVPGGLTGSPAHQARQLCALAGADGIACNTQTRPGSHTWKFAAVAFADALPWLADRVLHPGAARPVPPSVDRAVAAHTVKASLARRATRPAPTVRRARPAPRRTPLHPPTSALPRRPMHPAGT